MRIGIRSAWRFSILSIGGLFRAQRVGRPGLRRRDGVMLVECLLYLALFTLIVGLAFSSFYRTLENSTALERNAAAIARTWRTGERWRDDVRLAVGPLRTTTNGAELTLRIPRAGGEVSYVFGEGTVFREETPGGRREEVLANVKVSEFHRDLYRHATAWRWELELQGRQKVARVRPLFTFQAVARTEPKP